MASRNPQTDCRLMKLPPELREMVYGFVFAPEIRPEPIPVDENVAVEAASQLDLALTCRLFFQESIDLHQASYKSFWSQNSFNFGIGREHTYDHGRISEQHVELMNYVTLDYYSDTKRLHLRPAEDIHPFRWIITSDRRHIVGSFGCSIEGFQRLLQRKAMALKLKTKKEGLDLLLTELKNAEQIQAAISARFRRPIP